tara:strand:+ start:426 stop:983 length:558 start_codon:yes stop_codon:yes gene_type:complete
MSSIFYYSNYCEHSKTLIQKISQSSIKDDMHFISIDKRIKKNGATYIQFENGQEILLPPTIIKVPALLLLNRGHKVLFGNEISNFIQPQVEMQQQKAVDFNGEPGAFSFATDSMGCGITSDNYSFLDQDSDALSCKGEGGMRQQKFYAGINHADQIETPPDTYSADTINESTIEEYEKNRNINIK